MLKSMLKSITSDWLADGDVRGVTIDGALNYALQHPCQDPILEDGLDLWFGSSRKSYGIFIDCQLLESSQLQ